MANQTESDIWQEKRAFEDTNLHMLNENTLCDVTFHVGPNRQEIKAHKFILASRSPVFFAMFCGPLSQPECKDVDIVDINPDTMHTLLKFMYTEDCPINEESALPLLYAAKKYNVKRLEDNCQEFLSEKVSIENVCTILNQADRFNAMELKERCLDFVVMNASKVFLSDEFCELSRESLQQILQINQLHIDVVDVYNSCKKWAVHQLQMASDNENVSHREIRTSLGELLYLIRFPIMSLIDFTTKVSHEDVLSSEEKVTIFQYLADKLEADEFKFISKPRMQSVVVHRLSADPPTCWSNLGNADVIDFAVSKKSIIYGIGLYTPDHEKGRLDGNVSLSNLNECLTSKDVNIQYNGADKTENILFDNIVLLEPDVRYTLKCTLKGSSSFSGYNGLHTVVEGGVTVSFYENYSVSNQNGTSVGHGQIPFLILSASA